MGTLPRQKLGHCRFVRREVSFSLLIWERNGGQMAAVWGVSSSEWPWGQAGGGGPSRAETGAAVRRGRGDGPAPRPPPVAGRGASLLQ